MFKRILIALILLPLLFIEFGFNGKLEEGTQKQYKTEYLVVFVIDGPRYTETFGDSTYKLIPHLGNELKHEGVLYTNFMNNGVTHTTPGHTAITTGVYQSISNDGSQLPRNPSFFQYYLKTFQSQTPDTWVISSKGKLNVLGKTKNKKWANQFYPNTYCGPNGVGNEYAGDPQTWVKIEEVFTNRAPKLTLINLLAVDVAGHQNDWEGYKNGLLACDEYVYKLWNLIQSNPTMKGKTALLITNDHGRHLDGHKDGFVSHGDRCKGCRHISLLAMGPDFKKDVVLDTPAELIDISKTIAEIFHFEMPSSKGRVLMELFVD